jgi:hypothetical protein
MNIINTVQNGFSARLFAVTTIVSLLLSAFPVAFFVANAAPPTDLFTDSFETMPPLNGWDISDPAWGTNSSDAKTGTKQAAISGNEAGDATLQNAIDLTGYEAIVFSFWYKILDLDDGDSVAVEWFDGTIWNPVTTISGVDTDIDDSSDWIEVSQPLVVANNSDFEVRFVASMNSVNDKFFLDDVTVAGDEIPVVIVKDIEKIVIMGDTSAGENQPGWLFNRDPRTKTPFEFNKDEDVIGEGALHVPPIQNTYDGSFNFLGDCNGANPDAHCDKFIGELFINSALDEIESVSYDYQLASGVPAGKANEFYANAYVNFDDSDNFGHCVYNIVPTDGSAGWHTATFDPTQSYPVRTRGSAPSTCPAIPADLPDTAELRMFAINVGDTSDSDQDVSGYFDNVVLDTTTKVTTFDFEPEEEFIFGCIDPEATNYNPDATVQGDSVCEYPIEVPERCSVLVDEITVSANSAAGADTTVSLDASLDYFAVVKGTYTFGAPKNGSDRLADAEYSLDAGKTEWVKEFDSSRPDVLDLFIDGVNPDFGAFRSDHTYGTLFTGTGGVSNFAIQDNPHSDNAGELDVTIYECQSEPVVAVSTTKIVCDYESELPDWSGSIPTVTADTANDWLAAQGEDTTCRIVPEWEFEWADRSASNPGNAFVGPGGSDWTPFVGSTDVPLAAVNASSFWVREVLPEGYIAFVGRGNGNDRDSAELYCHTDGLNYDNLDRIDRPVEGGEYHCVAWNVPKELPPQTCSIFSDTETLVQDTNQFAVATHEHNNWSADIDDATWVWATERVENPGSEEMYTFVETFTVSNPTSALLDIAADNYYVVTVNGVEVLDRSAYSGNFTSASLKEDFDILPFLNVNGENTIEFKVVNLAGKDDYRKNPAGVLYRLDIEVDGRNGSCAVTTEPIPEPELPPVTSCSFVSDLAINDAPSQGNVASNLVSFGLNDLAYSTGDEFDLFVSGDTPANGPFSDEAVVERTSDGLRVFFYGTGVNAGPVKEFSGSFTLNGVDLTNAVIAADSEPNETTGNWPDAFEINPVTGEVTFTLYTTSGNDSFVITGLTENCLPPVDPQTYRISGFKWDDANGNGVYDESGSESEPEESTLSGWEIFLTQGATTTSTTTDGTGAYYFDVLAGEWTITEESPSGWTQTGQYQYGAPVTSSSESFGSCTFTIPDSENQSAFYNCSFGNQEDPESIDTEPEQRSTGGSSGTRTLRVAAPAPLVLGATTDAPQFCPFLVDYLQMGTDNDRIEVMKLQMFLNIFKGLFGGTENPVTGNFGIITDTNVKKFQEFYKDEILQPWFDEGIVGHTKPTGFVYKTTLWKINSIVCPDTAVLPDLTGENLQSNVDLNARAEQD